jgi:uncharacterized protein (TIGR03663 family)
MAGAAVLRLANLGNRPMHCDEAVQAEKFRLLLEDGYYKYDPEEYHGPSLNYLTLPIARLAGAHRLTEVTETQLRLLPALFGIALVGLVWPLREALGRPAALAAALLTAVSPAMVFYSRYYIAEMLLVGFTFAAVVALWRFERVAVVYPGAETPAGRRFWPRAGGWLVLLGLALGMMHATKESCVIALLAMAVAAAATMSGLRRLGGKPMAVAGLVVLLSAAGISALFFSSLLDNPRGVIDSVTTYSRYLQRAAGEGTAGPHAYPWYHYFQRLFWWHRGGGPVWSEASIAAFALVGLAAGIWGRGPKSAHVPFVRFLGIYTVLMTAVYCALPYKTPWCALGFLHGMILLAGVGMASLVRACATVCRKASSAQPSRTALLLMKQWHTAAAIALLAAATGHLAWQAYRASFVLYEDPNNPYVYAQTTSDVPLLARRIKQIAAVHPDGRAMHIQVICPDDDHWPLPWYLRDFSRVDWFPGIPRHPEGTRAAPLIITQPLMRKAVLSYVYVQQPPGQRPLRQFFQKSEGVDWQLRPNVPLLVIVRRDLLQAYSAAEARTDKAATGGRAKGP